MNDSPFVGRESELETLIDTVTGNDTESLIPVVGTTGIGKSTLLTEFVGRCRDRDHRVLHYNLKEPASVEQFLSRLLDHWQDVHPSVVSSGRQSTLQKLVGSVGSSLSKTSEPGTSIVGGILNAFVGGSNNGGVRDITSELLELATKTRDISPNNQFVLIIDQLDKTRIDSAVYDEITTILREISTDAPQGVVCCIGTRERFYDIIDPDVPELKLQPFDVEDVETYLEALGLDSTSADRVHDAASGSPYFVERIGQIAVDEGSVATVLDDLSEVETKRRRMLEERFLNTLNDFPRQLLRETCFLPELQPNPVAHALDADLSDVEDTLYGLECQSILTHLGYNQGNPVYRLHGLHRDFLRERLSDEDRAKQHALAAGYYAIELANTGVGGAGELITDEGIERRREYMTAGIMFEYHLQKFPSQMDAEERVDRIFESVPSQDQSAKKAALGYFVDYREFSIAADKLGVTPAVKAESIKTALNDWYQLPEQKEDPSQAATYELQTNNILNDNQIEVLSIIINTTAYATQVGIDNPSQEFIEELAMRRGQLNSEVFPNAPELCKLGRIAIDFIQETVSGEPESDVVWTTVEEAYGIPRDEFRILTEALITTIGCFSDWSAFNEMMREQDGSVVTAEPHLEDNASIEDDGIEGSLRENFSSPIFLLYRTLKSPGTEELKNLDYIWSGLEIHFEDNGIPILAALCRDIRVSIVDPVTSGSTPIGMELMNGINLNQLDVINHEPATTLAAVMEAAKGFKLKDIQRKAE